MNQQSISANTIQNPAPRELTCETAIYNPKTGNDLLLFWAGGIRQSLTLREKYLSEPLSFGLTIQTYKRRKVSLSENSLEVFKQNILNTIH